MKAEGFYYLHENGDLIWKRFEPEMEAGGFVKKVWVVSNNRETAWKIVAEALAHGALKRRIADLVAKWGLTDEDGQIYAKRIGLPLKKDGDAWAVGPFDDKSIYCGKTVLDALAEFVRNRGDLP